MLDFKTFEETDMKLSRIRFREFDVRAAATTTNLIAVRELQAAGLGTQRPPYVTWDGVLVDGRHLVDAYRLSIPVPEEIRVRKFSFSFDELDAHELAELKAWALKRNLAENGYRVYAKTEDISMVIKDFLETGYDRAAIRELLREVPSKQFDLAYKAAETSYDQKEIARVRGKMLTENLTPKQAAATLVTPRLRGKFFQSMQIRNNPLVQVRVHSGAKSIRDKQDKIDVAYKTVGSYTDKLYDRLGEPGYSHEIVLKVLKYHRETIAKLSQRFEEGAAVVEKTIRKREQEK